MKSVDHEAELLSLVQLAKAMTSSIKNDHDKKVAVGMLTDGIFQRKHYSTGLASREANKLRAAQQTKEHFYGRKASAKELVDILLEKPYISDNNLCDWVRERCRVHHVTQAENMLLRKYNLQNPGASWEEAYEACGVILEQRIDGRKRKK